MRAVGSVETHLVLSRWARPTIELETPFTVAQIRDLADVSYGSADQAAAIMPPMPAYYARPHDLDDVADDFAGRVLDQFGLETDTVHRWGGPPMSPSGIPVHKLTDEDFLKGTGE